jgi:hypothetical protein
MENAEQTKKTSLVAASFTYGLLTAIGLILITLLAYLFNLTEITWLSYLNYVILLAGIILGTIKFRDDDSGGFITYGKALGFGTMVSLFAAVISGIFLFVFYTFIAPDAFEQIRILAEQNIIQANPDITDQQLDLAMRMTTPLMIFISSLFSITFIGFVFSLVTSAFLKKIDPLEA